MIQDGMITSVRAERTSHVTLPMLRSMIAVVAQLHCTASLSLSESS
jgi:hypothetical protein